MLDHARKCGALIYDLGKPEPAPNLLRAENERE
jgi:hypothetical protein